MKNEQRDEGRSTVEPLGGGRLGEFMTVEDVAGIPGSPVEEGKRKTVVSNTAEDFYNVTFGSVFELALEILKHVKWEIFPALTFYTDLKREILIGKFLDNCA